MRPCSVRDLRIHRACLCAVWVKYIDLVSLGAPCQVCVGACDPGRLARLRRRTQHAGGRGQSRWALLSLSLVEYTAQGPIRP